MSPRPSPTQRALRDQINRIDTHIDAANLRIATITAEIAGMMEIRRQLSDEITSLGRERQIKKEARDARAS